MGSCISTQYYNSGSSVKHQHSCPIGSSIQEEHNHRVLLSTTRSPPTVTENLKSQPSQSPNSNPSQDMGYKDEIFYDSHQYIDSDCEDYLSFNGDFSTPGHENGFAETVNQISPECETFPCPTEKKKKLAQLFEDGFSDHVDDVNQSKKGESLTNHVSTVNKSERLKLVRSFSSCLPRNMTLSEKTKGKSPCQQQISPRC